jgi:pimeloyl-ACP methyl ester carboxylesterase
VDPSPHRVRFVSVAPDVKLEVLDWGGDGPVIIFLAGLGGTAHVFDDFAPALTDKFHVYGITRRGYGASSQSATGHDLAARGEDLRQVLDALGIVRVNLAGHSIAGDELTWFAGTHPERVDRLVYLDAAYDDTVAHEDYVSGSRCPDYPDPSDADKASPASLGAWVARTQGVTLPEGEIRAIAAFDDAGHFKNFVASDSTDVAVFKGCGHPDYSKVVAPALSFYEVRDSVTDFPPVFRTAWDAMDLSARAKSEELCWKHWRTVGTTAADFRAHAVHGRVVELHHSNHYIFIASRDEVLREMRAFLAPSSSPDPSPLVATAPRLGVPDGASPAFDRGTTALALSAVDVSGCKTPGGPSGAGRVMITLFSDGSVTSATVDTPTFAGTPTGECVANKFRSVRVPPFGGSVQVVSKMFRIE